MSVAYETLLGGVGGYTGIFTKGVMMTRYKSWVLLIIFVAYQVALLCVSGHCVKKPTPCPVPMYIFKKSYGLDSISCTIFVRVTGYKYLLSDALLFCRYGVVWGFGQ